jgi:hypothetical protein
MAYPFAAATRCFADPRTDVGIDRSDVDLGRYIGNTDRKEIDVDKRIVVLWIARDDDGLRVVMLAVMADENGNAMLVVVGMEGYFDIMRFALFDGGGLLIELGRSESARGDKTYPECNLREDRSADDMDDGDGSEEGGKVWREMHDGEEEMGVRCTREERRECYSGGLKDDDKE